METLWRTMGFISVKEITMYSKGYRELNPEPHSDKPGPLLGLAAGLIVVVLMIGCGVIEQIVSALIVACGGK